MAGGRSHQGVRIAVQHYHHHHYHHDDQPGHEARVLRHAGHGLVAGEARLVSVSAATNILNICTSVFSVFLIIYLPNAAIALSWRL